MNLFFLSILLIVSGGISALVLWRQFTVMKAIGVLGISAGCFLGLIDALSKLFNPGQYSFSISYLNALSLSFKIDNLAAFFLVAIFAVSLLAAIYSFHYMEKPEKGLRTSVNYLFFSLLIVSMAL
ncbi:MAG: hydrogenase, partial [Nitrospina sp.]|nr:hydrogenase [Nitrospina sp.]